MSNRNTWFITGASRGLGAQIARAALAAGDNVVAAVRDPQRSALPAHANLLTVPLDVRDEAMAAAAVAAAVERFGRIDILVNNAGFGLLGAVEEGSAAEIEALFATNVFGLLAVTRAVLPQMRRQGSGRVLNLSSLGGYAAGAGWGLYCASKFAVEGISEALAQELAPLGIHVTVLEPGFFRTEFLAGGSLHRTARMLPDYAATVGQVREHADAHDGQQPGDPEKLARVILEIAAVPDPPVRLPIGRDAVARIEHKHTAVTAELERWRSLSESTGFTP